MVLERDLDVEVDAEKGAYLDVEIVGRHDELKQGLQLHLDSSVMSSHMDEKDRIKRTIRHNAMCECPSTWMKLVSAGEMSSTFFSAESSFSSEAGAGSSCRSCPSQCDALQGITYDIWSYIGCRL